MFLATVLCLCSAGGICETTINIADFIGVRKGNLVVDDRGGLEVGYHSNPASLAKVTFEKVPSGTHPRILRFEADVYSIFSQEIEEGSRAVALHAIHSKNSFDFGQVDVPNCVDCLLWLQTPVGDARYVARDIGHLPFSLLTKDALWIKLATFANLKEDEVLAEATVSFEFCYDSDKTVAE